MIILRKSKAKMLLENSIHSALSAVEIYNKPNDNFRLEGYIILMIVAWTKLFHAYFQATLGEKYFYKEKNGRYKKIDGDKKAWELKTCYNKFQSLHSHEKINEAVIKNLDFFIILRNKIEHRFWSGSELDASLFGECQALLFNYENMLSNLFGPDYSINASLTFALQFSQMQTPEQIYSQRVLLSNDMKDIQKYIQNYRSSLTQATYDSQEYSVKLLQIPKVSNTNRSDLSIEFVNWNALNDEDKKSYNKITTLIKDKKVIHPVLNASLLKPSKVISLVEERTGEKLSQNSHTLLWKAFGVRPGTNAETKFETNEKFCVYDEPHNDYLYKTEWVDFITNLITKYSFNNENIKQKCRSPLQINDHI